MLSNIEPLSNDATMHETVPKSWAAQAAALASDPTAFQSTAPSIPKPRLFKYGTGQVSDKVKSVPRFLTCFVGRLEKDTSAEDLCSYLDEVGIKDAQCRKLEDKDGSFRTAAFRVSCHATYKNLFYDESNWPEGVVLRDWIFRRHDG